MPVARTRTRPARFSSAGRLVAAIITAALVAACGGTNGSTGTASKGAGDFSATQGIRFSECMRSHGVPHFPDPATGSGGGIKIQIGSDVDPRSPSFQAAQRACRHLLPNGGPPTHVSAQAKAQMLATAQCMRRHGLPSIPDPTTTPPQTPQSGGGLTIGRGGVFLELPPGVSPSSPAFQRAAAACHFPLAKH